MTSPLSANDVQVGGAHYKGVNYQHWDYAADSSFGYFEGQITKYISRHTKKNGLQDVQKAGHFLDKTIELARAGRYSPMNATATAGMATRFIETNDLGNLESIVVRAVNAWSRIWELEKAREAVTRLEELYAPKGASDSEGGEAA